MNCKIIFVFSSLFILFSFIAFSQTNVITYTFDANTGGWTSEDVSSINPHLTAPAFGYGGGKLSITSPLQLNPANTSYGYWINTSSDFSAGDIPPNSLFRGTFYISTDQANWTLVPQTRLALRNETAQLNSLLQINSVNNFTVQNTPTTTIKAFEHYFQPHDGSLYPAYDGLIVAFELINYFNIVGPDEGTLFLDRVVIDRFDLSSISWSQTQDFTLSLWRADTSPNSSGLFYTPDFYKIPFGSDAKLGIKSVGNNTNTYGTYVGNTNKLSIDGLTPSSRSYLYRGVFNVSADSLYLSNVPVALLALHQDQLRESSAVGISSSLGPDSSPDDIGRDYFVYFRPPLVEVTTAPASERYVYCEFDLLNFWGNDPYGGLFLNSAQLERTDIDNP